MTVTLINNISFDNFVCGRKIVLTSRHVPSNSYRTIESPSRLLRRSYQFLKRQSQPFLSLIGSSKVLTTNLGLTRVGDGDLVLGLAGLRAFSLDGLDDILAGDNLAEDDVLAVEPWARDGGDEELRSAGEGKGRLLSANVTVYV